MELSMLGVYGRSQSWMELGMMLEDEEEAAILFALKLNIIINLY